MALSKLSSRQLMEAMDKAEDNISELRSTMNSMRQELDSKMLVFSNAMEYSAHAIGKFNEYLLQKEDAGTNTLVMSDATAEEGNYSQYGLSVTPAYYSEPVNIFNFLAATGPIYKNNANVYINSAISPTFADMLMHDAVNGKKTAFEEFTSSDITIKISVNPNDLFGATACNTIELLPFIPGSFEIRGIRFLTMQDYRNQSTVPSLAMTGVMPNVGAGRIILPRSIDFYSCEIDIRINFKNAAGKYPFGLKHLYFLNANYNNNSYLVAKMSRDSYIDWISDDIVVHDQDGIRVTTCTEEGIEIYSSYLNGVLTSEIVPTRGIVQTSIARNTRDVYLKIPITKSITSIRFKEIGSR